MWAFLSKGGWVLVVVAVAVVAVNRELARAEARGAAKQLAADAVEAKGAWDIERAGWAVSTGATESRISSLTHELDSATTYARGADIVAERRRGRVGALVSQLEARGDTTLAVELAAVVDTLAEAGRACRSSLALCGELTTEQAALITAGRSRATADSSLIVQQARALDGLRGVTSGRKWLGCVAGGGGGYAVGARKVDAVLGVMCGVVVF